MRTDRDKSRRRVRAIDSTITEDHKTRGVHPGRKVRSGYFEIIGNSPVCEPGERQKAAEFLKRIELAISQGGWKPAEATRLYRLRDKWKPRAEGKDPRFDIAGTRAGRLPKDTETAIEAVMKRHRKEKRDTSRDRDRRRRQHDWTQFDDLDAPFGTARGGIDLEQLEGDLGDDDAGEHSTRRTMTDREFFIPGQDSKGHSHRVYCRVMPAHNRALSIIYTSKRFPFRTVGDVVRWCVDRGIRELGVIAKTIDIESVMSQVDTIKEICVEEAYQQDFIATFDLLGKTIHQHLAAKAIGEARRVVAMVKAQIEKMPEGYWRTRHLDEMKRRFGHVLDGKRTKGVPLVG